jgi:hypothetical protein
MDNPDLRDDGLGAMRGLVYSLPINLLLWALILWAVL